METTTPNQTLPVRGATLETTRFYMGSLMSFLVKSSETHNSLCLTEYQSRPGHEPPPHIHLDQDEIFYLLEGELEVYCLGQVRIVRAGEAIFLPRNQAHAWYVTSSTIRALLLTSPGGLDGYFQEMSSPATSMELPPAATTYALADPAQAIATGEKHGIKMLTPVETTELLPHYPGFGERRAQRSC
jgi:quercetin dioxygenase-like cupin family protein